MNSPQKFKKFGKAFIGYAVAIRSASGAELMLFCPTKDEAIAAAESWGDVEIDPNNVKHAALGPVPRTGTEIGAAGTHTKESTK